MISRMRRDLLAHEIPGCKLYFKTLYLIHSYS